MVSPKLSLSSDSLERGPTVAALRSFTGLEAFFLSHRLWSSSRNPIASFAKRLVLSSNLKVGYAICLPSQSLISRKLEAYVTESNPKVKAEQCTWPSVWLVEAVAVSLLEGEAFSNPLLPVLFRFTEAGDRQVTQSRWEQRQTCFFRLT